MSGGDKAQRKATLQESIAANTSRLRRLNSWSQARLAEEADIELRQVQRIEYAEIDCGAFTLVSLARALGVSVALLVRPSKFVRAQRGRPAQKRTERVSTAANPRRSKPH